MVKRFLSKEVHRCRCGSAPKSRLCGSHVTWSVDTFCAVLTRVAAALIDVDLALGPGVSTWTLAQSAEAAI